MSKMALALGIACMLAPPSYAQRVAKVTGTRLLALCTGKGPTQSAEQCDIYLSGVADAMGQQPDASRMACIPLGVTGTQLRDVALKLMHAHPEKLELPAAKIATHAFMEAFPCKK